SERMLSTVEDITDAAQLQAGQSLSLNLSMVDLGELARAVATLVTAPTPWSGAPSVHVQAPDSVLVEGDRARLERVLQNLIGNAVKYSPDGERVDVVVWNDDEYVYFSVWDHGVGIPDEELPHVFRHFYRASTSKGIAGTGIGLAGAKKIVEQH